MPDQPTTTAATEDGLYVQIAGNRVEGFNVVLYDDRDRVVKRSTSGWGPRGTGKTRWGARILARRLLREERARHATVHQEVVR